MEIRELDQLTDDELLDMYAFPSGPWVRMNFISSIDGAATVDGLSGGLGDEHDQRLLRLQRLPAHCVMVGSGTLKAEGYGAMWMSHADQEWRVRHGLAAHPTLVVVSNRLSVEPEDAMFVEAPVRPVVVTSEAAPVGKRERLADVAEVVVAGERSVSPVRVVEELKARGLTHVHGEGGPRVFGEFVGAGVVNELCVTVAPWIVAGEATRIAHSEAEHPTRMTLTSVLRQGSEMFLKYRLYKR